MLGTQHTIYAPPLAPSHGNPRIIFIDYLRILACVSVLVGHRYLPSLAAIADSADTNFLLRGIASGIQYFSQGGGPGVVLFLLVSGYIVTHALMRQDTAEFIIKRVFRIYPLYVAAIIIQLAVVYFVAGRPVPPLSILVPRLLLLGDLFGTPYAVGGAEWTLRLAVLFYAVMALARLTNLANKSAWLPVAFIAIIVALHLSPPITTSIDWSRGYVTLYFPFLFFGSCIYLLEHRLAHPVLLTLLMAYIYGSYLVLIREINPTFADAHFATIAILAFALARTVGDWLPLPAVVRYLSALVYSVYLFENWLWNRITEGLAWVGFGSYFLVPVSAACFFAFCAFVHWAVERPGIRLGEHFSRRLSSSRQVNALAAH